jgi:hypothetical protein
MKNGLATKTKYYCVIKYTFNGKTSFVGAKNKTEKDQIQSFIKMVNKDAIGNKNKYLNVSVID